MPRICPKYAQDMPEICQRYAQDSPRYARDLHKICPRYARYIPKIYPIYAQYMPDIYAKKSWGKMSTIILEFRQYVPLPKFCVIWGKISWGKMSLGHFVLGYFVFWGKMSPSLFWTLFGHYSDSTSINDSVTM